MPLERNQFLVVFDPEERRIRVSRPMRGGSSTVLHTEYDLDALLGLSFSDAGRQIGEDILLGMVDVAPLWPIDRRTDQD